MMKKTYREVADLVADKYRKEAKDLKEKGELTPEKRLSLWGSLTAALWGETTPEDEEWGIQKVRKTYSDQDEAIEARDARDEKLWQKEHEEYGTARTGANGFWLLVIAVVCLALFLGYRWLMTLTTVERVGVIIVIIITIYVFATNSKAEEDESKNPT